jgi:hypothetical protein
MNTRTTSILALVLLVISACQKSPNVPGFDTDKWKAAAVCSNERMDLAEVIVKNEASLLSATQPDIEALLGVAPKHELHGRNEKFFYYPISKDCLDSTENQSLFLRFDALGRVKEVLIVLD